MSCPQGSPELGSGVTGSLGKNAKRGGAEVGAVKNKGAKGADLQPGHKVKDRMGRAGGRGAISRRRRKADGVKEEGKRRQTTRRLEYGGARGGQLLAMMDSPLPTLRLGLPCRLHLAGLTW